MILEQAKEDIQGIILCAFEVYNELHGGLLGSVYEEAFTIELHSQGYHVEQQKELSVWGIKASNWTKALEWIL